MAKYKISVSINGENYFWIVIENGKIIKNPTKSDLKLANIAYYNKTNICHRCREENEIDENELTDKNILYPGNAYREKDKNGDITGKWICNKHSRRDYQRYDPNSNNNVLKSIAGVRTGNLRIDSKCAKGNNHQELACELYGWEDLNKKNDNYSVGTPIDCFDPKTESYHQIRGISLRVLVTYINVKGEDVYYKCWELSSLENEWLKIYENMVFFCFSDDEKIIERIYIFPLYTLIGKKNISICKNNITGWHEIYRVKDKEKIKRANDTWNNIRIKSGIIN